MNPGQNRIYVGTWGSFCPAITDNSVKFGNENGISIFL